MWGIGEHELATAKISHVKAPLRDGGAICLGADSTDARNTAVIQQGCTEHNGTHKEGCVISAKPTCDGDLDLIDRSNRGHQVFVSRTGAQREQLGNSQYYKFIRKVGEMAALKSQDAPTTAQRVVEVARGTSWRGINVF